MIRVLIADDHQLVRQGFQALLARTKDIQVIGEARNGNEAVELAVRLDPDVVVMDIHMPGLGGIKAAKQISALGSNGKVLILSMYSDESLVREAMREGAKGYLLKHNSYTELITAIRAVAQGKTYFSPEIVKLLLEDSSAFTTVTG